jgi:serine/threonine-protein kinase
MIDHLSFDNLVGTTLGNYRLERLLEQSELGAIFQARNEKENTAYLLRVLALPSDLTAEARMVYLGRFQKEANQVSELHNPDLLPLLDYGNHQGIPYLVTPRLSATPLSTVLSQKGPLDILIASRYLDKVATALEYAHAHAVLHRNLSADCILLKSDGTIVVADFGVMRMLELSRLDDQVKALYTASPASSPAPEQLLGKPVDTSTDVYALGAVLYRMLTGHRPFRGKTREEIVQQHLQAAVPPLSKWRSGLPAQIDGIIAKAMAKDPAQRYRQPGELANAYHQIVAPNDSQRQPIVAPVPAQQQPNRDGRPSPEEQRSNVGAGLPPALPTPALRSSAPRVSRRRALTMIGAGGGAVAIAAVAVFASHYLVGTTSPTGTTSQSATASQPSTGNSPATKPPAQGNNPPSGHVLARTSDVPVNSAKTFPIPNNQNPGLLIHLVTGQFVAFDSTCTHAGCAVNYNPQDKLLECPCHGAVFDPAKGAAVVAGPAPSPLAKIAITVSNGVITQP